jgi:6-pyruvoyltetrahydropterin/6-carboxytetrahydropterin synthase
MFSVCVRDHFMVAHSLRGETFGPAQQLHGATYVVDLELRRPALDRDGVVADIGAVAAILGSVLQELNFKNLDEEDSLRGVNTSTEYLAKLIFERVSARIRDGGLGDSARGLTAMRVTLHESHVAWASYEDEL